MRGAIARYGVAAAVHAAAVGGEKFPEAPLRALRRREERRCCRAARGCTRLLGPKPLTYFYLYMLGSVAEKGEIGSITAEC